MSWTDPFPVQNDERRPTRIAPSVQPPSQDVVELKQVALWHGDRRCISQANEAAAEGIMKLLRWSRSRFRPREIKTLSQNQERATTSLNLPTLPCLSSPSHPANVEECESADKRFGHVWQPLFAAI